MDDVSHIVVQWGATADEAVDILVKQLMKTPTNIKTLTESINTGCHNYAALGGNGPFMLSVVLASALIRLAENERLERAEKGSET